MRLAVHFARNGRHMGKGKDNIEMGVQEVGLRGMDWADMAQDV
jgi:hypothetical protein